MMKLQTNSQHPNSIKQKKITYMKKSDKYICLRLQC